GKPAGALARPHRRRALWAVAATVVAAVVGTGGFWLLSWTDVLDRPLHRSSATGADWEPWEVSVPADAAGDGKVRAGFCTYGEQALYCSAPGVEAARVDPANGNVVWRIPTDNSQPAETEPGTPPAPVISGGLVHVMTSDGDLLSALDPAKGEPRWTRNVSAYGGRVYHAGDTLLLVAVDGTVTAVDSASGKDRWSRKLPGMPKPVLSSFADSRVGPGQDAGAPVYAVSPAGAGQHRTQVLAFDPLRGTTLWQRTFEGDLTATGVGPRGALYLTAADSRVRVATVVRYDPVERREQRIPLSTPLNVTSAAARGDTVYLLSSDGGLTAVGTGAGTGTGTGTGGSRNGQLWRLDTSVANASALVLDEGRLYFSAADGRLLAVDTVKGTLLGQTSPRLTRAGRGYLDLLPAPVAADGKVFGAAPDGTVFAVSDHDPAGWR
ncbi:PQQ-binding-like beta-propeller repeat protein, partial [Streptomyces sp. UNOC14_S4]|uniref:outer membrane protein assembly factor BamB family protein n=1 Tax=Streptomyces sp. UNOC14_S4 TaxID=2872340 RepID=UPI001E4F3757